MIYFIRKYDFKIYFILTIIATCISIYSIYYVTLKFGKISFSQFAFYSILTQIFYTISDLGTKISYFKNDKTNIKADYKYLLSSKLLVALLIFIAFSLFYGSKIYYSFIFTLIGTSIFPTSFLQEYRLYTIIAINNLLFRVVPLILILKFDSIEEFSVLSGIVIIVFSTFVLYNFKIINTLKFNFKDFYKYFREVLISNKYLSAINIVSIIEINLHTILAKKIFPIGDFADYIYMERYINYLKQAVIYLYDYLYPKVKLLNLPSYIRLIRYIYISYALIFFIGLYWLSYFDIEVLYGIKMSNLFYIFCLYPLSSLIFNFIINIVFYKYSTDKSNFSIIILSVVLKTILIWTFSTLIGIEIIPIVLILFEIFMGLTRFRLLPLDIRSQIKF